MRSFKIGLTEIKRLLSANLLRLALGVICLVPLLYGGLWLWAFWDPYQRLDKIPVAVVNLDEPAKVGSTRLNVGSDLVKKLNESKTFDWRPATAAQAKEGLEKGDYYMSLTVPRDFSRRLANADDDRARAAVLTVAANESKNLLASQIAGRIFLEIRSSLAQTTTKTYLDHIFLGIGTAKVGMKNASKGAKRLADALQTAANGSGTLAAGIHSASSGAHSLSSGLSKLSQGTSKLKNGASAVAHGAGALSAGVDKGSAGATKVAAGSRSLASGASSLTNGLDQLSSKSESLSSGGAKVSAGAAKVSGGVSALAQKTGAAAAGASKLSGASAQLLQSLQAYAQSNPEAAQSSSFQTALALAGGVSSGAAQLSSQLGEAAPLTQQLAAGAADVSSGAATLSSGITNYVAGVDKAAGGAAQLSSGAAQLSNGAGSLAGGLNAARSGAKTLAAGSQPLAAGSTSLNGGAAKASTGSHTLASGLTKLSTGGDRLSSGLTRAASGGATLATALGAGAERLPQLSEAGRTARAEMMSAPVDLQTQRLHEVPNYGTGFAPYFIPLALWLGALMTYFIVRPLNGRALASTASSPRIALSGLIPGLTITFIQTTILVVVLRLVLHLNPVRPVAFLVFLFIATLSFTAILQLLTAALGTSGKFVAVLLLMLQLTSAAGTFPVETVPRFFQVLNPLLPMSYVVKGLRQALSGNDLTALSVNALVLLAFAVGAFVLTILATRRQRTWTIERIKPVLTL